MELIIRNQNLNQLLSLLKIKDKNKTSRVSSMGQKSTNYSFLLFSNAKYVVNDSQGNLLQARDVFGGPVPWNGGRLKERSPN